MIIMLLKLNSCYYHNNCNTPTPRAKARGFFLFRKWEEKNAPEGAFFKKSRYLMSTVIFLPEPDDAVFIIWRIACAILPCLPITLPISSGATESSRVMLPEEDSVSVTVTLSGSSTIALAMLARVSL